jgi:hypothetical protein
MGNASQKRGFQTQMKLKNIKTRGDDICWNCRVEESGRYRPNTVIKTYHLGHQDYMKSHSPKKYGEIFWHGFKVLMKKICWFTH